MLDFRDEVDGTDPPGAEELSTPAAVSAFFRHTVETNLGRPQIVRLYVVLGAEAVDPAHPAHQYFADREKRAYAGFEGLLGWKKNPALAARELMSFWTGLERQWVMDPTLDFLAIWDQFADRFFVVD